MPVSCPSCLSTQIVDLGRINAAYLFAGHALQKLLPGGNLFKCNACHLQFRNPAPPKAKLDELYRTASITHWQYEPDRRLDWQEARTWITTHFSSGKILDIGCFDGAFHKYMGQNWEAFGVEINESAREKASAQGVTLLGADLAEIEYLKDLYDVVVAFDVIEHVINPQKLLNQMAALTRPGGAVIVASGDTASNAFKMMKSNYWYCTIPEHMAFVSKAWYLQAAQQADLTLSHTKTYSHERNRTIKLRVHESLSNVLYRFFPAIFKTLRRVGLGDKDVSLHKELVHYPPTWTSAKDHLIAIFTKR